MTTNKLYITEFESLTIAGVGGSAPWALADPQVVDQVPVVIGTVSAQSAPFGPTTTFVRLWADAKCSIAFGKNPVASAYNMPLGPSGAGDGVYFGVRPGDRIAVITNTGDVPFLPTGWMAGYALEPGPGTIRLPFPITEQMFTPPFEPRGVINTVFPDGWRGYQWDIGVTGMRRVYPLMPPPFPASHQQFSATSGKF